MIFDTGANVSITGEKALFIIPPTPLRIAVSGINTSPMYSEGIGATAAGIMLLIPRLTNTLVSHSFVKKSEGYNVEYSQNADMFTVRTPEHEIEFIVDFEKGLPVAEIPKEWTQQLRKRAEENESYKVNLERAIQDVVDELRNQEEANLVRRVMALEVLLTESLSMWCGHIRLLPE